VAEQTWLLWIYRSDVNVALHIISIWRWDGLVDFTLEQRPTVGQILLLGLNWEMNLLFRKTRRVPLGVSEMATLQFHLEPIEGRVKVDGHLDAVPESVGTCEFVVAI